MFKNRKLSTSITFFISIVALVCIGILYLVSNNNMSTAMSESAEKNMVTSLETKTQIIDEYIANAEHILAAFSMSGELREYVKDKDNQELKNVAQDYNTSFYSVVGNWEGLYLDTWDSEVITHSNPEVVGMVMREGDKLKSLQDGMLASDGVMTSSIIASPASGELVISMYAPMYEGKTPIGFAGGALKAAGMKELLDASSLAGYDSATYSLINVDAGVYIFDNDATLMNTEIKDPSILKIIDEINNKKETGSITYTGTDGEEYFSVYKSLSDRGWALIIRDKSSEIFSAMELNKIYLGWVCIGALLLITLFSWLVIRINTKPLTRVLVTINNLKNLDLRQDDDIKKYIGYQGEVGMIATAIDSLSVTFRQIILTLNDCSKSLTKCSDTMSVTSKDLLDTIENNSATTEELSASILCTNSSIGTVTSEIQKMTNMVGNIEERVKDSNSKSEKLIDTAEAMNTMADKTLDNNKSKIESTKKNIEVAIKNLQSLNKINEMATQILNITSQTNLLSLNASIEAARAGEAGRGFAVVAGEIGTLAESSSKTASEIQSICEESDKSIESVRMCFDDIITFMEADVSGRFKEFADMAKEYGDAVKDIKSAIASIDESSTLVVESVSSIKKQIENVNTASSDNAAGVDDIIVNNNLTTTNADSIIGIADENQRNAMAIKDIVDKFTK
ncbi:MAG: methyl-accepting chemotaxis protein [Lachnospiraceae bacterium]|nr:methyl-accepting chemotaxis protein [Lachnospiraceae bacterium]